MVVPSQSISNLRMKAGHDKPATPATSEAETQRFAKSFKASLNNLANPCLKNTKGAKTQCAAAVT